MRTLVRVLLSLSIFISVLAIGQENKPKKPRKHKTQTSHEPKKSTTKKGKGKGHIRKLFSGVRYYVDDQTTNTTLSGSLATPFKTIDQLNTKWASGAINAGDSILFKRGGTYFGTLLVKESGTISSPIVVGAYGTGNKPLLTSRKAITGWALDATKGANIWKSTDGDLSGLSSVNMVVRGDNKLQIGRWPNLNAATEGGKGWIWVERDGKHTVTDGVVDTVTNHLLPGPVGTGGNAWAGAVMVHRTSEYSINHLDVQSNSGTRIVVKGTGNDYDEVYGPHYNSSGTLDKKWGFFMQDHIKTLDQQDEWFFNTSEHALYMYSTSQPQNIEVPTKTNIIDCNSLNDVHFVNLEINGSSGTAVDAGSTDRVAVKNCKIVLAGDRGINGNGATAGKYFGDTIKYAATTAIWMGGKGDSAKNCVIVGTDMIRGMGAEGSGATAFVVRPYSYAGYNIVDSSGFQGIKPGQDTCLLEYNLVRWYDFTRQDGGGIYSYGLSKGTASASTAVHSGTEIKNNMVLFGVGSVDGTLQNRLNVESFYFDANTNGFSVHDNVAAFTPRIGYYLNDNRRMTVRNNLSYGSKEEGMLVRYDGNSAVGLVRNMLIKSNVLFVDTLAQWPIWHHLVTESDFKLWGQIDSNWYCRPRNENVANIVAQTGSNSQGSMKKENNSYTGYSYDLTSWKNAYNPPYDANSKKTFKTVASLKEVRFVYNPTFSPITVNLHDSGFVDVKGNPFTGGQITLQPLKANILLYTGKITTGNRAPTATLITAGGSYSTANHPIILTVDVTDLDNNLSNVKFYYGSNTLIGQASATSTPGRYTLAWSPAVGSYTNVKAIATDAGGLTGTSGTVSITVTSPTTRTNYYLSSTGSNSANGTSPSTPWQTLAKVNSSFIANVFHAGDSILFKRGDVFTGNFAITYGGSAGSPIVFSSYGAGSTLPTLQYNVGAATNAISARDIIFGSSGVSFITIDGLKFTDATENSTTIHADTAAHTGVAINFGGNGSSPNNNITIRNCDISLIGGGIVINGNNTSVTGNRIYDLGGIKNNTAAHNGIANYGARGVVWSGNNGVYSSNYLKDLWYPTQDPVDQGSTNDGKGFEMYGAVGGRDTNNVFTYNTVINTCGLAEMSSGVPSDIASNNTFAYNLIIDAGRSLTMHTDLLNISNTKFYNNTVVEKSGALQSPYTFWTNTTAAANTLIAKNNIFYYSRYQTIIKSTLNNTGFVHSNNLFRMASAAAGQFGFTTAGSEVIAPPTTAIFVDSSGSNASTWNLRPRSGAPQIDIGTTLGFTQDFYGTVVPKGAAPDAGAIESTPTANQRPSVALSVAGGPFTAPATINMSATASDADGSIISVDFYKGTTLLRKDSTYAYSYSLTGGAAGTFNLMAIAVDDLGGKDTSIVSVTVDPAHPTATITLPTNNQVYTTSPTQVQINVIATDADGTVRYVDFYSGGIRIGTDSIASGQTFSYLWQNVTANNYTLTAVSTDNTGLKSQNPVPVSIQVNQAANKVPRVVLTAPANKTYFTAPATIDMTATASDTDGVVTEVQFYSGNTPVGPVDNTGPSYTNSQTGVGIGTYYLSARAKDDRGAVTISNTDTVTVKTALTVPNVYLTSPAPNEVFSAPAKIRIAATATTDNAGDTITHVDFYATTTIGTTKTTTLLRPERQPPYLWDWNNVSAGVYKITAKAYDTFGLTKVSDTISVTVKSINKLPVIALTSPINHHVYPVGTTTVTLTAAVSDTDGYVTRVDFYRDGGLSPIGSDISPPTFQMLAAVTAGTHVFKAIATDNSGGKTTSKLDTITVSAPLASPNVSVTAPKSSAFGGQYVEPATINLGANVSDPDGTVTQVSFYEGSNLLATDTTAPFSDTWTGVEAGTYTVTAVAVDDDGNQTTSAPYSVSVRTLVSPSVNITAPLDGDSMLSTVTRQWTADASDPDGQVNKVEFFINGSSVGVDTSSPYSHPLTAMTLGDYILSATATDDDGLTSTSAEVHFRVYDPPRPPTIYMTSPVNDSTYLDPTSVTLAATAADQDGTISGVDFYDDTTFLGSDNTAPYSFTWTNIPVGTHLLTAKATDNAGLTTTSARIRIYVTHVNINPGVGIINPESNDTFFINQQVNLTAAASDPDGTVTKVEFYSNGQLIGTSLAAAYSVPFSVSDKGTYTFIAKAYDNDGGISTSEPITLLIKDGRTIIMGHEIIVI